MYVCENSVCVCVHMYHACVWIWVCSEDEKTTQEERGRTSLGSRRKESSFITLRASLLRTQKLDLLTLSSCVFCCAFYSLSLVLHAFSSILPRTKNKRKSWLFFKRQNNLQHTIEKKTTHSRFFALPLPLTIVSMKNVPSFAFLSTHQCPYSVRKLLLYQFQHYATKHMHCKELHFSSPDVWVGCVSAQSQSNRFTNMIASEGLGGLSIVEASTLLVLN